MFFQTEIWEDEEPDFNISFFNISNGSIELSSYSLLTQMLKSPS